MKSLVRLLVGLYLGGVLVACSQSGAGPSEEAERNGGVPNTKMQDLTDYSICDSSAKINLDLQSETWIRRTQMGETIITDQVRFTNNEQIVNVTCESPGGVLKAKVRSPMTLKENSFEVLGDRHQQVQKSGRYCAAIIRASTLNYRIHGQCLEILDRTGVASVILVRQKSDPNDAK